MPSARQPQPGAGRNRDLRAVSLRADRLDSAEGHRHARRVCRARAAQDRRAGLAAARPRVRVPGRDADSDLSPVVPAAEPRLQAGSVGGSQESARRARSSGAVGLDAGVSPMRLVQVAVPVPTLDALTYAVPDDRPDPPPGARVLVPLGNRTITGVSLAGSPDSAEGVKQLVDVIDAAPFLPADVLQLATWVAEYYACGIGEALAAAMPPRSWVDSSPSAESAAPGQIRLLSGRSSRPSGFRTIRIATITAQGHEPPDDPSTPLGAGPSAPLRAGLRLGPQQRELLTLLQGAPDGLPTGDLDRRGFNSATLRRLAALGLISLSRRQVERDPFEQGTAALPVAQAIPHTLTAEQAAA